MAEMERLRWFDRFPSVAETKIPAAVWGLSRDSAGMMFRFKTDATSISAHYVLRSNRIAKPSDGERPPWTEASRRVIQKIRPPSAG